MKPSESKYRVRWYERGDLKEFLKSFELIFGKPMGRDYWHWKYVETPFVEEKPPIIVAEEVKTDTQVGFRGCFFRRLEKCGDVFKAINAGDLMVHPVIGEEE